MYGGCHNRIFSLAFFQFQKSLLGAKIDEIKSLLGRMYYYLHSSNLKNPARYYKRDACIHRASGLNRCQTIFEVRHDVNVLLFNLSTANE